MVCCSSYRRTLADTLACDDGGRIRRAFQSQGRIRGAGAGGGTEALRPFLQAAGEVAAVRVGAKTVGSCLGRAHRGRPYRTRPQIGGGPEAEFRRDAVPWETRRR